MPYPRKLRDKLSVEELYRLYWVEKMTMKQIAELFDCTYTSVQRYMKSAGIPTRDKYAYKWLMSPKSVNENFFSEWTKEMAYVLGVIITDGAVESGTGDLKISMTDKDVVEKIANAMELKNGISKVKRRGNYKQQYRLSICRKKFVNDLSNLGVVVTGDKTHKQGRIDVPKEFRSHFVRGIFDGDGSLVIRHRITPAGNLFIGQEITIVSASKELLECVAEMVNEDIGIDISVKSYKGGTKGKYSDLFRINFADRVKVAKFLKYIYKDKGNLFMDRKFQKYMSSHLINI